MVEKKRKEEILKIDKYLFSLLSDEIKVDLKDFQSGDLESLQNDLMKVTSRLKNALEHSNTASKELSKTLADISHQLKTPLTALMLTNDILKSNDLSKEELNKFLNKETKELERMEWLITTLLKYSKLDSGSVTLKKETIKAYQIIESALEPLSIQIELKNIEIIKNNLNFNLNCDINWTKEAFTNILKNAVEYLDNNGTIIITGENNPLYKAITIKDNGKGIKESDIKNIFKRFYSTNSSKNSVGIGLNMAKLIFEKQNGSIEVTSEVGKYTSFKIIFYKNII